MLIIWTINQYQITSKPEIFVCYKFHVLQTANANLLYSLFTFNLDFTFQLKSDNWIRVLWLVYIERHCKTNVQENPLIPYSVHLHPVYRCSLYF